MQSQHYDITRDKREITLKAGGLLRWWSKARNNETHLIMKTSCLVFQKHKFISTHIIVNRNRDREVRTPMKQSKRREPLCRVSTPRRIVMTCIKDVVRRSQYVKRNKMRDLGNCRWVLKRAFKVGGIVTHPRVPGDASVIFSDEMLTWVINRRSARTRTRTAADVRCGKWKEGPRSHAFGKSAENLNLKVRWHRLTAYKSLQDFTTPFSAPPLTPTFTPSS